MAKKDERVRVDLESQEGLIIDRASLLSNLRLGMKFGWGITSWLLWLDLLRPVLLAALWYLGYRLAKSRLYHKDGPNNLDFFVYYSLVLAAIFLVTFGWNRYNFYRFRGTDRRRPKGECDRFELARYYAIDPAEVENLMTSNAEIYFEDGERITIHTDTGGRVIAMYAPQNLDKHFDNLRNEDRPVYKCLR